MLLELHASSQMDKGALSSHRPVNARIIYLSFVSIRMRAPQAPPISRWTWTTSSIFDDGSLPVKERHNEGSCP